MPSALENSGTSEQKVFDCPQQRGRALLTEPGRLGTGVIFPKLGFFFVVLTICPLIFLDIKSSLQFLPTCCWVPEDGKSWTGWTVVFKSYQLCVSCVSNFPPVISQHQTAAPLHPPCLNQTLNQSKNWA